MASSIVFAATSATGFLTVPPLKARRFHVTSSLDTDVSDMSVNGNKPNKKIESLLSPLPSVDSFWILGRKSETLVCIWIKGLSFMPRTISILKMMGFQLS